MPGLAQGFPVVEPQPRHQGIHAAAQVADAHGAGKGIAVHLAESLYLHGAGKGDQGVGGQVEGVGKESHQEEQQDFHQQHQLPPVQAAVLFKEDADQFGGGHARGEGQHRHQVVEEAGPVPGEEGLPIKTMCRSGRWRRPCPVPDRCRHPASRRTATGTGPCGTLGHLPGRGRNWLQHNKTPLCANAAAPCRSRSVAHYTLPGARW